MIGVMMQFLVFQEELLMQCYYQVLKKVKRMLLLKKWNSFGEMPLTHLYIKIGLVE
jgi:hypothetical protein